MPVKPTPEAKSWIDDSGLVHGATRVMDFLVSLEMRDVVDWVPTAHWTVACGLADTGGRLADGRTVTCLWCAARSHRRTT